MELNISLLKEVCEIPGAPGYEHRIRKVVLRELEGIADEVKVDNMGNVIAVKKGRENKKVMAAAHMDEIGFIVTYIDNEGFVFFNPLGGFDPKTLTAQRVIIHGKKDVIGVLGSKPIHMMSDEERKKNPQLTDYYVDCGLPKEEVEKYISVGDTITRERELIEIGDCVNSKSLDNRVAVFILLETIRNLKEIPYDFYGVFTVQEEVGIRGASVAAHHIDPDFGIGLDTTIAFDLPGAKAYEKITRLGEGVAVKIMDSSVICDQRMVRFMKETAEKHEIKYQLEIMTRGGTDTAGVQRMGKQGAIAGAISIPTRHLHQVIEMCHKQDITNAIELLSNCLYDMDKFDWQVWNS